MDTSQRNTTTTPAAAISGVRSAEPEAMDINRIRSPEPTQQKLWRAEGREMERQRIYDPETSGKASFSGLAVETAVVVKGFGEFQYCLCSRFGVGQVQP